MRATGVFLTESEKALVQASKDVLSKTPVMGGYNGGPTMADCARRDLVKLVNCIAMAHGLRDLDFWYSVSLEGELVIPDGYEDRDVGMIAKLESEAR